MTRNELLFISLLCVRNHWSPVVFNESLSVRRKPEVWDRSERLSNVTVISTPYRSSACWVVVRIRWLPIFKLYTIVLAMSVACIAVLYNGGRITCATLNQLGYGRYEKEC